MHYLKKTQQQQLLEFFFSISNSTFKNEKLLPFDTVHEKVFKGSV